MKYVGALHQNNICSNLFHFLNTRVPNHLNWQFKPIGISIFRQSKPYPSQQEMADSINAYTGVVAIESRRKASSPSTVEVNPAVDCRCTCSMIALQ